MTTQLHVPVPEISRFLADTGLAPRQPHKALTLWPLVRDARSADPANAFWPAPEYIGLAEALEAGQLLVDEVDEQGSVPHVRVTNRGAKAVLVLFGEELRGAKQNRIANASFLVPPKSETVIDVSCVEQGRWGRRKGERFDSGLGVSSSYLRSKMSRSVSRSLERGGRFTSDQGEVWNEVQDRIEIAACEAPTSSYHDYYESRSGDVDEIVGHFRLVPDQVGFVAAIGEEIVGVEAIGRPEVFEKSFVGLLRGYAVDAVDAGWIRGRKRRHGEAAKRSPRFEEPEPFLEALGRAEAFGRASLGIGHDWRLTGRGVSGCALVESEVVHLTAFADAEAGV